MPDKLQNILEETRRLKLLKEEILELDRMELSGFSKIFDIKQKINYLEEKHTLELEIRNKMYNDYTKAQIKALNDGKKLHHMTEKSFKKQYELQNKLIKNNKQKINTLKSINTLQTKSYQILKSTAMLDLMNLPLMNSLMEFDKAVRDVSLHMGLSSQQSEVLRTNFEGAYQIASRLGATSKDLSEIQQTYSQQTGRARILTSQMLEDVVKMYKGTGMAASEASNLAGQFEVIGYNATATMNYIQNVVDMSERVGVNVNNVMKSINLNFRRLQTYGFKHGVDGMSRLAIYGEKYRMNMESVLTSMDKARGLEDVIDMAASLQVLGGQFAAMADPMAMLFEARNDPEAYAKRLNTMTKGMVALRKTSDGFSFELASPMARDMLDRAAQALGISTDELTQQALRQRELTEMRRQMLGMGVNSEQKELIESLAQFDTRTGRFTIQVGKDIHNMNSLTKNHLSILSKQQDSLEQRAKNAQTFDDMYRATIQEFKTILLPLLRGVNNIMQGARTIIEPISNFVSGLNPLSQNIMQLTGSFMVLTSILPSIIRPFIRGLNMFRGIGRMGKTGRGAATGGMTQTTAAGVGKGVKGGFGAGAGVGVAGLGIGAGVGVAALGISTIAESLEKLDTEKVKALQSITTSLTILGSVAAVAGAGVMILGKSSLIAAPGLLALGGSIALVGTGIGLATAGIGVMAMGLSQLIEKGTQSKDSLLSVAGGILAIQGALATGIFGSLGLLSFAGTLGVIAASSSKIEKVGDAFKNITTVLKGSSTEYERINNLLTSIQEFDTKKISALSGLGELLGKPLKVEFSEQSLNLVSNITLEIDGKKFIEELNLVKRLNISGKDISDGKSSR